jgi:hypothetical protein
MTDVDLHASAAHAAVVGHTVVLGKLPVKHDDRNLKLARYTDEQALLAQVPPAAHNSKPVPTWPMYLNHVLPDCTAAGVGHATQTFTSGAELPSDDDVRALFEATGPPGQERYSLDVLNHWRTAGFGADQTKIFAYVQIDPDDRPHVECAMWLFGGLYAGLQLPRTAQHHEHWTLGSGRDAEPGSWGGHCVWVPDYSADGLVCVTWGRLVGMTWDFWERYCEECYAILSAEWATADKPAPNGFNLHHLIQDLATITDA